MTYTPKMKPLSTSKHPMNEYLDAKGRIQGEAADMQLFNPGLRATALQVAALLMWCAEFNATVEFGVNNLVTIWLPGWGASGIQAIGFATAVAATEIRRQQLAGEINVEPIPDSQIVVTSPVSAPDSATLEGNKPIPVEPNVEHPNS